MAASHRRPAHSRDVDDAYTGGPIQGHGKPSVSQERKYAMLSWIMSATEPVSVGLPMRTNDKALKRAVAISGVKLIEP
jgi:hypothetical protein